MSITPHGGNLVNLLADARRAEELKLGSREFPSWTLSQRQICDLELLTNGGLSPLRGFMTQEIYEGVLSTMRLSDGRLWPVPITLDVPADLARKLGRGQPLALRDSEGFMLAVLTVEDLWQPDKRREARELFGTESPNHPGVRYLYDHVHDIYVGGSIESVQLPQHHDFTDLRHTPQALRQLFQGMGWRRIVGFHTSKPMHRLHRELTLNAARDIGANILIHPAVGMTKPGDLHYFARVRCYQAIIRYYPHRLVLLSLLPSAMRMAGPREALLNAIIRQNYGCTHFMIGYKHAHPPGFDDAGEKFYGRYAAQELATRYQEELAIQIVPTRELVYCPASNRFLHAAETGPESAAGVAFTNSDINRHLKSDLPIPHWVSYPEVLEELRRSYPPRSQRGITLFFTGLSGAGKSTLARILYSKFIESGDRSVTLLDGDLVRQHLSSELGFSKEHRDINVRRIGFVAGQITKNNGIAICAPIAPYAETRQAVRELVEQHGDFLEIHVSTPLEVCESRDRKGLYAKARRGQIPAFTGISDPYEVPANPDIRIDTANLTPAEAAQEILLYLLREGYLDQRDPAGPSRALVPG